MYTIGLDISKGYADVVFAENKKVIGKPFLVDDTNNGYSTLEKRISELPKEEVIKVGFESTGGYENIFLNFFQTGHRATSQNRTGDPVFTKDALYRLS